ncbi:TolB family protein [Micromonospora gifhornensis]|uniref:TolB family protein n=1 Tax=Micromonospora gifhornensis TaxID=84594 RepID=UPI003D75D245
MTGIRQAASIVLALLVLTTATSCTQAEQDDLPTRVMQVPAEVRGLGPAVLAVPLTDEATGLLALERFGDDLAGLTPARRHTQVALGGDPRFPTVARGLGEDRRDAVLVDGRLRDVTLPDFGYADRAFSVESNLSITESRCLTVTGDGRVGLPAVEAFCKIADRGGVIWEQGQSGRYGGIDLASGAASPAVELPSYPIAATPDGRYLAALTSQDPRQLVIVDTRTGQSRPTVTVSGADRGAEFPGVFTSGGFALLRQTVPGTRRISLVTPKGEVRDLLSPVGEVAFAPDGRRAIVVDTRSGKGRLSVLDLKSGAVTPVVGDGTEQPDRPAELPPVTGTVTATVSGDHALVVELEAGPDPRQRVPRPSRAWSVRLSTATATSHPNTPEASEVTVWRHEFPPTGAAALSALWFEPGKQTLTLSPDGTVTSAPPGTFPRETLGDGAVLHTLLAESGRERVDRLLVTDSSGGRVEIPTGAGPDQRVANVILTPDQQHLLISLRPLNRRTAPGDLDVVMIARRDGTGKPVVVYQGAWLVSLGIVPTSTS